MPLQLVRYLDSALPGVQAYVGDLPVLLLVDTGAASSLMLRDKVAWQSGGVVVDNGHREVFTVAGRHRVRRYRIPRLAIGSLQMFDVIADDQPAVLTGGHGGRRHGDDDDEMRDWPFAGTLGLGFLRRFHTVVIDSPGRQLTLHPADTALPRGGRHFDVLGPRDPRSEVMIGGVSRSMLWDTGTSHTLLRPHRLPPHAELRDGYWHPPIPPDDPVFPENLPIQPPSLPEWVGDGIIGMDVLRWHRLRIDFARRVVVLDGVE